MEPLKQFMKIGTGLAAVIGVTFLALPERPTLLAGGVDIRAEAPLEPLLAEPAASEPTPAEPAAPDVAGATAVGDVAGVSETELAGSSEAPQPANAAPIEDEAEREPPTSEIAAVEDDGPSPGQLHLQRLRGETPAADAGPPAEEPLADPVPAESAAEEAPAEEPLAGPSAAEFAFGDALPQDGPSADELAVPDEPSAGGGSGLASLTEPAEQPQFRLLPSPEATDSGTILAGNQAIRLSGIVPVPSEAVCADGAACGTEAREAVQSWLAGRAVLCAVPPSATSQAVAPCLMGEEDVGEWIVANGWAEAEPGSRYVGAQERARADGRGIWASGGR